MTLILVRSIELRCVSFRGRDDDCHGSAAGEGPKRGLIYLNDRFRRRFPRKIWARQFRSPGKIFGRVYTSELNDGATAAKNKSCRVTVYYNNNIIIIFCTIYTNPHRDAVARSSFSFFLFYIISSHYIRRIYNTRAKGRCFLLLRHGRVVGYVYGGRPYQVINKRVNKPDIVRDHPRGSRKILLRGWRKKIQFRKVYTICIL